MRTEARRQAGAAAPLGMSTAAMPAQAPLPSGTQLTLSLLRALLVLLLLLFAQRRPLLAHQLGHRRHAGRLAVGAARQQLRLGGIAVLRGEEHVGGGPTTHGWLPAAAAAACERRKFEVNGPGAVSSARQPAGGTDAIAGLCRGERPEIDDWPHDGRPPPAGQAGGLAARQNPNISSPSKPDALPTQ